MDKMGQEEGAVLSDNDFDAIIVGGGPAGLAIASELSAHHKVLVLEKGEAGATDRFWFVPPDVLDEKTAPFAYGGVTRFLTRTYSMQSDDLVWRAKLFGPDTAYPYIRDREILNHWAGVVRDNGSQIVDHCPYHSHAVDDTGVHVASSLSSFRGRLLIDCSGFDSPIVRQYGFDRSNFYWWSVYGAVGKHPKGIGSMQVGDYMMWQTFADADPGSLNDGKPVFEYEILDGETSFSLILYLRKVQVDRAAMREEFFRILRQEASTADFHDVEVQNERWGWYPSGGLNQQIAEERVAFAGDAACWTTPCGWGMTFILENYRFFAEKIGECLAADTLDRESILTASHFRLHDRFEITTDVVATHFLANASTAELDKFIRLFMADIDPILCEKVFTLKVTQEELLEMCKAVLKRFSIAELCRLMPAIGVTNLLREVGYFTADGLADTVRELFRAHPDTEGGFEFGN
jgi:flavin-dependent dehydrogenase